MTRRAPVSSDRSRWWQFIEIAKLGGLRRLILMAVLTPLAAAAADADQAKLDRLLRQTTRIEVKFDPFKPHKVYESSKPEDLDALRAALRLKVNTDHSTCLCIPDPTITLFAGGRVIGKVEAFGAGSVKFTGGEWDGLIADPEVWVNWFDHRGMPQLRAEVAKDEARSKEADREWENWRAATPEVLRPFEDSKEPVKLEVEKAALHKAVPDEGAQIRLLFAWNGSGSGPWTGYPAYEDRPEELLLTYPTAALVGSIGPDADEKVLLGAGRLFSQFWRTRKEDLGLIDAGLKKRLLERAMKSPIEDVRKRARAAFGQ
jgi:hypothetical protein